MLLRVREISFVRQRFAPVCQCELVVARLPGLIWLLDQFESNVSGTG